MIELMKGVLVAPFALWTFGVIVVMLLIGIVESSVNDRNHVSTWAATAWTLVGSFWLLTALSTGLQCENANHDRCVATHPTHYEDC
jgi:hypothetical protein